MSRQIRQTNQQRGAVLITALVILMVLTILGVSGVQTTTLQERMAGNYRDGRLALEAAEAALKVAEARLYDDAELVNIPFDGTNGSHYVGGSTVAVSPWDTNNYVIEVSLSTLAGLSETPKYYLEKLGLYDMPGTDEGLGRPSQNLKLQFYRVGARGVGLTSGSEVLLFSTFFRYD